MADGATAVIPEVWRLRDGVVQILGFAEREYLPQEPSMASARLTSEQLNAFREWIRELDRHLWLRRVRHWARQPETSIN